MVYYSYVTFNCQGKNGLNYSKNAKNMYNTLVFHIFDSL